MTLRAVALLSAIGIVGSTARAQEPGEEAGRAGPPEEQRSPEQDDLAPAPAEVTVRPEARDEEIRERLQRVLDATGWFTEPRVRVDEGVVFLSGSTESDELKRWAGDLARKTQDVVAAVNRMEVRPPSAWDFAPARSGLDVLWRDVVRSLPLLAIGLVVLALSAGASLLATRCARALLRRRIRASLLRSVIARGIGALVFLIGAYIVLRVSGLTQLALTVIGGTGLVSLAIGIAFRDITENFLASIFLSMQRPFETSDLIEVAGVTGYVQQLNVRTTIVMTLEGNLVQIPNATVYKSNLRNFTANANRREDFKVGIGYDDSTNEAQEVVRAVLADHPAVLDDPEPWVLVDGLGPSTVDLRVYFWLDGREHSWLKVRSSVIRLVKLALQRRGISLPDEARELVFPRGVPVTLVDGREGEARASTATPPPPPEQEGHAPSTKAEGGLGSEAGVLNEQARQAKQPGEGENLLDASAPRPGDGQG